MRSGSAEPRGRACRRAALAALATLGAAGPLAGCSTTVQAAARLRLNSARILASQTSTRVTRSSTSATVQVTRLATIAAGGRSVYVVWLRNGGQRPVSDLPISVGYTLGGRRDYLNAGTNLGYFDAHLPVLSPAGSLVWVLSVSRRLPAGARPFALVGAEPSLPVKPSGSLPRIVASPTPAAGSPRRIEVALDNVSGLPQYQLPVYALARQGDRIVAAGAATVQRLGAGSKGTVAIPLLGQPGGTVQLEAVPTIVR